MFYYDLDALTLKQWAILYHLYSRGYYLQIRRSGSGANYHVRSFHDFRILRGCCDPLHSDFNNVGKLQATMKTRGKESEYLGSDYELVTDSVLMRLLDQITTHREGSNLAPRGLFKLHRL